MGLRGSGLAGASALLVACYATHPEQAPAPTPAPAAREPRATTEHTSGAAGAPGAKPPPLAAEPPRSSVTEPPPRPGLDPGVGQSLPDAAPSTRCTPFEQRTDLCGAEVQALCAERNAVATTTCQLGGSFSQCTCQLPDDPLPGDVVPALHAECVEAASVGLRQSCASCLCLTTDACVRTLLECDDECWRLLRCALPCIDAGNDTPSVDCLAGCVATIDPLVVLETASLPGCIGGFCAEACSPPLRD